MGPDHQTSPDTIVLIHGLWMTPLSWEHWIDRYSARGYRVLAPAWPGMDVDIEQLRADTSAIDHLGIEEIVDHYGEIIRGLDAPPIIMGHSFGGAFTEVLLDRGLGAAGVAISPAPIKGILALPPSSLKVASVALKNPANRHKAVALTPKEFHYGFTNTLSDDESRRAYERYAIPGLIAGGSDHTVPAVVDESMAKHYGKSKAITDYKEFPGRSHFTVGEDGWEEVADYALDWAVEHTATPTAA